MAVEKTFSIIKPDAVAKNAIGEIVSRFEKAGLCIVASRMTHLNEEQAQGFYAEHKATSMRVVKSTDALTPVKVGAAAGLGAPWRRDRLTPRRPG